LNAPRRAEKQVVLFSQNFSCVGMLDRVSLRKPRTMTTALIVPPLKTGGGKTRRFNKHVEAAHLRASGHTWRQIAKHFGIHIQTLCRHIPDIRPMAEELRPGSSDPFFWRRNKKF